jgi:ferritin-like metal-binding protein YciE
MATQNMRSANTALSSKLGELFVDQLKDIYWAEKKLVKTLPKLEEAATSPKLKQAFGEHLVQTQFHVSRLEKIFEMIGLEAEATKCPAMAGIVDEGEEIIDETTEGSSQRDAGLIFAGQKAEHYEIATYGGLSEIAETLGYRDIANILSETLSEEKQADVLLTEIAEGGVNERASQESGDDE